MTIFFKVVILDSQDLQRKLYKLKDKYIIRNINFALG